jgi:hypothetical protein
MSDIKGKVSAVREGRYRTIHGTFCFDFLAFSFPDSKNLRELRVFRGEMRLFRIPRRLMQTPYNIRVHEWLNTLCMSTGNTCRADSLSESEVE